MKLVMTQANLTLKGGAERVVLKVAKHYGAKIYTAEYDPKKTFEEFRDVDVEVIGKAGISKILPYGRATQGLNYGLSFYNFKVPDDYDVLNAHIAPSHWVRNRNERVLWYVNTPLRDVYDLYHYRLSLKKIHQKPVYMIGTRAIKLIDQSVVKKIEGLIANSRNVQSRIERYYGRHDSAVLGGGIDYKDYSNKGDDNYFFYVSRFSPNKRQDYAISAFEAFKKMAKKRCKLVVAGAVSRDSFYYDYYLKVVEMAKRVGGVKIITDPSDRRVRELYSNCTAALYTPINEDYGLVPLEAMA
ncbi:MAG: glycosyltransferase, partial [Candidatus Micrarchaeota archaeon]|nr:glycosyltransferase [Candidatus Micrarchaeota archaeon]